LVSCLDTRNRISQSLTRALTRGRGVGSDGNDQVGQLGVALGETSDVALVIGGERDGRRYVGARERDNGTKVVASTCEGVVSSTGGRTVRVGSLLNGSVGSTPTSVTVRGHGEGERSGLTVLTARVSSHVSTDVGDVVDLADIGEAADVSRSGSAQRFHFVSIDQVGSSTRFSIVSRASDVAIGSRVTSVGRRKSLSTVTIGTRSSRSIGVALSGTRCSTRRRRHRGRVVKGSREASRGVASLPARSLGSGSDGRVGRVVHRSRPVATTHRARVTFASGSTRRLGKNTARGPLVATEASVSALGSSELVRSELETTLSTHCRGHRVRSPGVRVQPSRVGGVLVTADVRRRRRGRAVARVHGGNVVDVEEPGRTTELGRIASTSQVAVLVGHPSRGRLRSTVASVLVVETGVRVTELNATRLASLHVHVVGTPRVIRQLLIATGTGETAHPSGRVGGPDLVIRVIGSLDDVVDLGVVSGTTGLGSITLARSSAFTGRKTRSKVFVGITTLTL
jgi:hypothetical protein